MSDDRDPAQLAKLCTMSSEHHPGTTVVRLHGEFDLSCEEPFRRRLGPLLDGNKTLILDLEELSFMDSTGLALLVELDARARKEGLDFTVLCGDGAVRRVLSETGLDGVLPVVGGAGIVPRSDSPI